MLCKMSDDNSSCLRPIVRTRWSIVQSIKLTILGTVERRGVGIHTKPGNTANIYSIK